MSLTSWTKKELLTAAVVVPAVLVMASLIYTVTYRIPDLEAKIDRYNGDQEKRAEKWEAAQQSRLDSMDLQLVAVRTNLLRLCSRTGSPDRNCQIRELVSTASDIVRIQSRQFASARIQQPAGTAPDVAIATKEALIGLRPFPRASNIEQPNQIAAAATWATAAKDSRWFVENGTLRVVHSNGRAEFAPAEGVSQASLRLVADDLNTISQTIEFVEKEDEKSSDVQDDVIPLHSPSTSPKN